MLRLLNAPDEPVEPGWVQVLTPLGASAHVQVNSPAHELCDEWRRLSSGRMQLIKKANFAHWFGPLFTTAPIGVVAELLLANGMQDPFAMLLSCERAALDHVLDLANHCFCIDAEEAERLEVALDLARRMHARLEARSAAAEAMSDA